MLLRPRGAASAAPRRLRTRRCARRAGAQPRWRRGAVSNRGAACDIAPARLGPPLGRPPRRRRVQERPPKRVERNHSSHKQRHVGCKCGAAAAARRCLHACLSSLGAVMRRAGVGSAASTGRWLTLLPRRRHQRVRRLTRLAHGRDHVTAPQQQGHALGISSQRAGGFSRDAANNEDQAARVLGSACIRSGRRCMLQVASDVAIKHAVDCPSAWGSGRSKQGSRHGLWRRLRARSGTARSSAQQRGTRSQRVAGDNQRNGAAAAAVARAVARRSPWMSRVPRGPATHADEASAPRSARASSEACVAQRWRRGLVRTGRANAPPRESRSVSPAGRLRPRTACEASGHAHLGRGARRSGWLARRRSTSCQSRPGIAGRLPTSCGLCCVAPRRAPPPLLHSRRPRRLV